MPRLRCSLDNPADSRQRCDLQSLIDTKSFVFNFKQSATDDRYLAVYCYLRVVAFSIKQRTSQSDEITCLQLTKSNEA